MFDLVNCRELGTLSLVIEPARLYRTSDPELSLIAQKQTLAMWRCQGRGPAFVKAGHRILYRGKDIIDWLERNRVEAGVE